MPWKGLKASDLRRRSMAIDRPSRQSETISRSEQSQEGSQVDVALAAKTPPSNGGPAGTNDADPAKDNPGEEDIGQPQLRSVRTHTAPKHHRFSLLRFRHASDPQLSASYAASEAPPMPVLPPPQIITTSPTANRLDEQSKQRKRNKVLGRARTSLADDGDGQNRLALTGPLLRNRSSPTLLEHSDSSGKLHVSFDRPARPSVTSLRAPPPAYGDESASSLALPVTRLSESSRSDASSVYATTTTTHTIHTTTTFFRIPRRKKDKGPLFPLPVRISPPVLSTAGPQTPRPSISGRNSESPDRRSGMSPAKRQIGQNGLPSPVPSPSPSMLALTNAPAGTPGPSLFRRDSTHSHRSAKSLARMAPPFLGQRGRSSTMSSTGRKEENQPTPSGSLIPSGRTSTSTTGRKSFGDLFSLSARLRQNSEPSDPRHGSPGALPGTPGSVGSKPNSLSLPRETLAYPERTDEDTPAGYLEKLEEAVNRGVIASILCKSADDFSKTCLRKYMRGFSYFGDSIDIAIRKMLMEVELPKETQQIDRLLQGFADRYCECNPGIFVSTDEAYFVAFSILLLHSDTHNKNNKRKMQKSDYVKNTQDQVEVSQDILECFYDNVSYTPFIHFDDEVAINSHRAGHRSRKNPFKSPSNDALKGPIDPYTLILDNKLDLLRPSLKDVMRTENTYKDTGTADSFDVEKLHSSFVKSGILQIVSARSRPDAFLTPATISNPADAQAGLVDIKAAKVGLLWRKDPKKKKARSPWAEWGAILTGSQLYFFRDVGWVKTLMSQQQNHWKNGNSEHPVVFRPPLTEFKPDALMSMDDSVALLDSFYKKHKNAFIFIKHGGFEEVFLANDDADMNDWIAKLNYAATFRTAGIRMRGLLGTSYEGQRRAITRANSALSEKTIPSATGDVQIQSRRFDQTLAQEIITYRRQLMMEKINDANEKLGSAQKELDNLLRNARHLQIICPIQQRTREGVVFAAGRMSAKLKWTRVEMGRTKCHRDILRLDLDDEEKKMPHLLGREPSLHIIPPQSISSKPSQAALARLESSQSNLALSPKSASSDKKRPFSFVGSSSTVTEPTVQRRASLVTKRSSQTSLQQSAAVTAAVADLKDDYNSPQSSPALGHRRSSPSLRSRSDQMATPTNGAVDESEERMLRDAGLIGIDGSSVVDDDSEAKESTQKSEERAADATPSDKAKNRSSLRRTLRDSAHGPHSLAHHRSHRNRDSTGAVATHEGRRPSTSEGEGLTRSTGSFTVHGKKASVITFGQDWNILSPEERLKMRRDAHRANYRQTSGSAPEKQTSTVREPSRDEGSVKSTAEESLTATGVEQSNATNATAGEQIDRVTKKEDDSADKTKEKEEDRNEKGKGKEKADSISASPLASHERNGSGGDVSVRSGSETKPNPLLQYVSA